MWNCRVAMHRVRHRFPILIPFVALLLAGCHEEGDIKINKLEFDGVKQVDKTALANALQTKRGSKLPWGHKTYFDRHAFDADLERIRAFYNDRGFPNARVASPFQSERSGTLSVPSVLDQASWHHGESREIASGRTPTVARSSLLSRRSTISFVQVGDQSQR